MMKLPPDLPGLSNFERRGLEDALRQQEMIDRAIGPAQEILRMHQAEKEMVAHLARPEVELMIEWQAALEAAINPTRDLDHFVKTEAERFLEHQEALDAAFDPAIQLEKSLRDGTSGVWMLHEAAERARQGTALAEIERAAKGYGTFGTLGTLGSEMAKLEDIWDRSAGLSELERAMKIVHPWIDIADPARSFAAFGYATEIGQIIAGAHDSVRGLEHLLGAWSPPPGFALWDEARRLDAYTRAGIDMRLFDIPQAAFREIAREVGIVQLPPRARAPRPAARRKSKQRASGPAIVIPCRVSIDIEVHAQVQAVEAMLRSELETRAARVFGTSWMKHCVHGSILAEWRQRQANARMGRTSSLLAFSTFGELVDVIQRKNVWNTAFADVQIAPDVFRVTIGDLIDARNAADHGRALDQWEFSIAFAAATRVQRAFGAKPFKVIRKR